MVFKSLSQNRYISNDMIIIIATLFYIFIFLYTIKKLLGLDLPHINGFLVYSLNFFQRLRILEIYHMTVPYIIICTYVYDIYILDIFLCAKCRYIYAYKIHAFIKILYMNLQKCFFLTCTNFILKPMH